MRKVNLIIVLFCASISFAQDFSGKVEYFRKMYMPEDTKVESPNKEKNPEMEKQFKEAMELAMQKKFELTFNKTESAFEEVKELEKPRPQSGIVVSFNTGTEGLHYTNLKENYFMKESNLMDKGFIIKDELKSNSWVLLNETKKIGDFTCNKAELTIPVSDQAQKNYEESLQKYKDNPKKYIIEPSAPKPNKIIAWYTLEIPVSFGPEKYFGLPGLILEVKENEFIYLATKVSFKKNEKVDIKKPKKGKIINQKKFDEEEDKFNKRMMEEGPIIIKKQN